MISEDQAEDQAVGVQLKMIKHHGIKWTLEDLFKYGAWPFKGIQMEIDTSLVFRFPTATTDSSLKNTV